jgi:hypothetical protein
LPTFSVSKKPTFIPGYGAPESDTALRGEVDAEANTATSVWQHNPDWIEKDLMDFHAILEAPEGLKHTRFAIFPRLCLAKHGNSRPYVFPYLLNCWTLNELDLSSTV